MSGEPHLLVRRSLADFVRRLALPRHRPAAFNARREETTVTLWVEVLLGFLLPVLLVPVSMTIHEFGHLAAARLVGYPALRLRIGPFVFAPASGSWSWRWVGFAEIRESLILGAVRLDIERRSPHALRRRHLLVRAAGPAAQVLVGVGTAVVALAGGGIPFWISAGAVTALGLLELLPVQISPAGLTNGDGFELRQWL